MDPTDKRKNSSPLNGLKGGVKTPEGKAISNQNSTKHGIFAKYTTSLDEINFQDLYDHYSAEFGDDSPSRAMLIRQLTVLDIRLRRCARFESEFIKEKLNPPKIERRLVKKGHQGLKLDDTFFGTPDVYETVLVDKGEPMTMHPEALTGLDNLYNNYEKTFLGRYCQIIEILTRTVN